MNQEHAADFVPIPDRLAEEAEGRRVVALRGLPRGLPNPTDGSPSQAHNPGADHLAKEGMDFLTKSRCQGG